MILPFDYIGYKRLSENKRFPNQRLTPPGDGGGMGECPPLRYIFFYSRKKPM